MTSSVYPGALDGSGNLPAVTPTSPIVPSMWNNAYDAIVAIETALGIDPQGTYGDVAARLTAIAGMAGSGVSVSEAVCGADVPMAAGATWYDAASLALGAGSYLVSGSVLVDCGDADSEAFAQVIHTATAVWLGSARTRVHTRPSSIGWSLQLVLSGAETVKVQCAHDCTSGTIKAASGYPSVVAGVTRLVAAKYA